MKMVRLHKFLCRHERNGNTNADVYVNPEKVSWLEEVVDEGRRHACIYTEGDDFINVFEQVNEVVKILEGDIQYNNAGNEKANGEKEHDEKMSCPSPESNAGEVSGKRTDVEKNDKKPRKPRRKKVQDAKNEDDALGHTDTITDEPEDKPEETLK